MLLPVAQGFSKYFLIEAWVSAVLHPRLSFLAQHARCSLPMIASVCFHEKQLVLLAYVRNVSPRLELFKRVDAIRFCVAGGVFCDKLAAAYFSGGYGIRDAACDGHLRKTQAMPRVRPRVTVFAAPAHRFCAFSGRAFFAAW